ncbi:hypothetical protein [Micromonospora sediminimaris]|uniref:Uncharacterized protein n=1 Tax=Micromonospora sediminimaris TaxID=547162 RepID=A0A9W5XLG3_9ACTN|nr:hypothetical protein [Micromonospora sediminimaris]GIJ35012.1 hypothetical protein Vse01_41600 [Micromonospora sediminimaris]SFD28400.1 hypothetical protein SAMN05216284_11476 [Micromonospora sediminimaris]
MDVAEIVTSAIAVLALLVSGWSVRYARASARSADKSAGAAERSADAAERQAAAAEAALPPPPPDVAWSARRDYKDRYLLKNIGTKSATGVEWIKTGDSREDLIHFEPPPGRVLPGGELEFFVIPAWTDSPTELLITWDGQSEPVAIPIPS